MQIQNARTTAWVFSASLWMIWHENRARKFKSKYFILVGRRRVDGEWEKEQIHDMKISTARNRLFYKLSVVQIVWQFAKQLNRFYSLGRVFVRIHRSSFDFIAHKSRIRDAKQWNATLSSGHNFHRKYHLHVEKNTCERCVRCWPNAKRISERYSRVTRRCWFDLCRWLMALSTHTKGSPHFLCAFTVSAIQDGNSNVDVQCFRIGAQNSNQHFEFMNGQRTEKEAETLADKTNSKRKQLCVFNFFLSKSRNYFFSFGSVSCKNDYVSDCGEIFHCCLTLKSSCDQVNANSLICS